MDFSDDDIREVFLRPEPDDKSCLHFAEAGIIRTEETGDFGAIVRFVVHGPDAKLRTLDMLIRGDFLPYVLDTLSKVQTEMLLRRLPAPAEIAALLDSDLFGGEMPEEMRAQLTGELSGLLDDRQTSVRVITAGSEEPE